MKKSFEGNQLEMVELKEIVNFLKTNINWKLCGLLINCNKLKKLLYYFVSNNIKKNLFLYFIFVL